MNTEKVKRRGRPEKQGPLAVDMHLYMSPDQFDMMTKVEARDLAKNLVIMANNELSYDQIITKQFKIIGL